MCSISTRVSRVCGPTPSPHATATAAARRTAQGCAWRRSTGDEAVAAYWSLYETASRERGHAQPSHPRELFSALLDSGHAELWLARLDGRVLAGGMMLRGSDDLLYWSGAMDRRHQAVAPSNAVLREAIRSACSQDIAYFDFGASSGNAGVERFKGAGPTMRASTSGIVISLVSCRRSLEAATGHPDGGAVIDDVRDALGAMRDRIGRRRTIRRLEATFDGIQIHRSAEIRSPDRLTLGAHVVVDRGVLLHCGAMAWSDFEGSIAIGAKSYIGPNSVLFGAGGRDRGRGAHIPGCRHHVAATPTSARFGHARSGGRARPRRHRARRLGQRRRPTTIVPGVRLGRGSVVGAGAVVRHDVPAMAVVAGVPSTGRP